MGKYTVKQLRNVALIAHGGAGKTTLAEALLFCTGSTKRLGSVDDGSSILDYDPEEIKRKISINTAVAPCEWNSHKINILDTPGYFDFVGEVAGTLRVADGVVITVCAASGVEVGTEKAWTYCEEHELPRMFFINKMDRENANFYKVLDTLQAKYGTNVIPLQLPIGQAEHFRGFIDLVRLKAYTFANGTAAESEIPQDMMDQVQTYRESLMDAAAVTDDDLAMKYLEGEELTQEEIEAAIGIGTRSGVLVPVLLGSAKQLVGIQTLLDYLVGCMPSPDVRAVKGRLPSGEEVQLTCDPSEAFSAIVFKTMADPYVGKLTLFKVCSGTMKSGSDVYNVSKGVDERIGQLFLIRGKEQIPVNEIAAGDLGAVAKLQTTVTGDTLCTKTKPVTLPPISFPAPQTSMAVVPKAKGDEDKIGAGLQRLTEEDPTITVQKNVETGQIILSGMGEQHLEVITSRLKAKFGVEVELNVPKVPYRETIRGKVQVEGKHKKQSGGRGQYGHVWLEIEPLPPGGDFEFIDKIFGGAVPRQYIPAVEKGVRETMAEGVLAGYPVVDVRVTLYDGSYHSVDSSEMAFKIAASMAFKKGFMEAKPVLLEPIMNVEITVPESYMGDIIGDMNKRRGRILGMTPKDGMEVIRAQAPQAEMFRYAIDLRSMTQGRGSFSMEFDHYEEVPAQIAEQVIAESKKGQETA